MSKRKVLVVGDSHVYALMAALEDVSQLAPLVSFEILRNASQKNGSTIGDITVDSAVEFVSRLEPDDLVVTHYRGNQYNTIGLIQHPKPFDLCMQSIAGGQVAVGAELIPVQLMRNYMLDGIANGYGKILLRIRAATKAPVVCVAAPAPKEDAQHILKGAETYFREHGISEIGVTAAPVRLKLWTLQQQALSSFCTRNGIQFLGNPPEARTEEGYLKREYYADDGTHANAAYGALVLAQIRRLLEQPLPSLQPATS